MYLSSNKAYENETAAILEDIWIQVSNYLFVKNREAFFHVFFFE